jgi:hypothetical protein
MINRIKITIFVLLYSCLISNCSILGDELSNVETPKYRVLNQYDDIEIRDYEPMLLASTTIDENRNDSLKSGFKILADYIFGNNKANTKIAMTAPVMQYKYNNSWVVSFMMPSAYNANSLPYPYSTNISIKEQSKQKYIVIRFSGFNSDANIARNEEKLKSFTLKNKIKVISSSIYAFYNPPWTLPFLKRNEIWLKVASN